MLIMSYIGDHVWLMTSRQTEPELSSGQPQFPVKVSNGGMEREATRQNAQLIDIGVKYAVHESNAGALVGILVWELDVNFPEAALEGC